MRKILSLVTLLLAAGSFFVPVGVAEEEQIKADATSVVESSADPACQQEVDGVASGQETLSPELAAALAASCIWCSSSSQCQPICGGTPGFDFACIYDEFCGGRVCVCL